jgi:hypothetical protein
VVARAETSSLTFPLLVGVVHWVIVQVVASLAYRYGHFTGTSAPFNDGGRLFLGAVQDTERLTGVVDVLVSPMRLWDGLWYQLIADKGYEYSKWNSAFWPLFPWTMRALGNLPGMSTALAGYLIANVSFFVALILLYKLVALDFDEGTARRLNMAPGGEKDYMYQAALIDLVQAGYLREHPNRALTTQGVYLITDEGIAAADQRLAPPD